MILTRLSPTTRWLRSDPWRSWTNYSPGRGTGIRLRLHFIPPRLFHGRMRRIEGDQRLRTFGIRSEQRSLRACFENGWRGRHAASRPPRSAARRPELPRATLRKGRAHRRELSLPFRPASRRTAQASGPCHPKLNFQTRSERLQKARIWQEAYRCLFQGQLLEFFRWPCRRSEG